MSARNLRVGYRPSKHLIGGVEPYLMDADTGEDLRVPFKSVTINVDDVPTATCVVVLLGQPCVHLDPEGGA